MDIFASSGGAVNALALVAKHPEQVRTLVAHEPPASTEVPDHEAVLAACAGIRETYYRSGFGPAMAKFIAVVSHEGPFPDGYADQPGPDPAMFGLPAEDDGSRDDPLLSHNIITCNAYRHDFDALRKAVRPASRTPSPPPCARSSPPDDLQRRAGRAAGEPRSRIWPNIQRNCSSNTSSSSAARRGTPGTGLVVGALPPFCTQSALGLESAIFRTRRHGHPGA